MTEIKTNNTENSNSNFEKRKIDKRDELKIYFDKDRKKERERKWNCLKH